MVVRLAKAISERWMWVKAGVPLSSPHAPSHTKPQPHTHTTHHVHTPHIAYAHTTQKAIQGNCRCKSLWTAHWKVNILFMALCRRTTETARMCTTVTQEEKYLFPRALIESGCHNYYKYSWNSHSNRCVTFSPVLQVKLCNCIGLYVLFSSINFDL